MTKIFQRLGWLIAVLSILNVLAGCALLKTPPGVTRKRNIEYARVERKSLLLDLYTPKKQPAEKLPVLIYIHGGSWLGGSKFFCPIGFMATGNVAIASINYRLSGEAKFPAQIHDCKGAVRWLRANAEKHHLDAERIGVFGVSAGGHLAALLATTTDLLALEGDVGGNLNHSSRVRCVCAFYPPTELNQLVTDAYTRKNPDGLVARLIGGAVEKNIEKALAASPVTYASSNSAPIFLMHGEKDTLVPASQSRLLYDALKKSGAEVQLEIIPGKGHGITAPPPVAKEIYQFFNEHLLDKH